MVKISVIIITFNEERNIARCIDSVQKIADEIVVVDSFSKDLTKKICLDKGVRFIEHPFEGHIQQKNFALTQATYDHVLSLDADEYLSEELAKSILQAKEVWVAEAYKMNRLSSYAGKWIKHGNWYPDKKIRMWHRQGGKWGGENPHDKVILNRGVIVVQLEGNLMHRAYSDSSETLMKIQNYSSIFAKGNAGVKSSSLLKICGHSVYSFFKSYFLKKGFRDGFEGLMVAAAEANHVLYKYAKLFEENRLASIGKRIVISRTDSIGDVILTLPVAGYLKSIIPDAEIFFVGKKYTEAVIKQCVHIDCFLDREEVLKTPSLLASIKADTILFIYPDKPLAKLAKQLNIPQRVATAHRWFNWIYCNRLAHFSRLRSDLHESQLNFKLLKPFGLNPDIDLTQIPAYYGLTSKTRDFGNLLNPEKINLIIHPKSRGSSREWGLENYFKLIKSLPQEKFSIFITGLKEEEQVINGQFPELLTMHGVHNLMGKYSLQEMISLIYQADGLVASSTGVLHLSSSLGKFSLGLYPPIKPIHPGRWKPVGAKARHLVLNKKCNDCKYMNSCHCISSIKVSEVRQVIEQSLSKEPSNEHVRQPVQNTN